MTQLPPSDRSRESSIVSRLAEKPLVYAIGLAAGCPRQNREPNCPLRAMDGLSMAEKIGALEAMEACKLSELLQHHAECMAQGGAVVAKEAAKRGRPLSIMLSEDDPHTRMSLSLTLKRAGHRTLIAESADALLGMLGGMTAEERGKIDLLVTDLIMPGKMGEELIRELDARGFILPVVVITAYGSAELEQELRRRGNVTILSKPFHPDDLVSAVQRTRQRFEEEWQPKVQREQQPTEGRA